MRAQRLLILFILTILTSSMVNAKYSSGLSNNSGAALVNDDGLKIEGRSFTNLCPNGCSVDGVCGNEEECKRYKRAVWGGMGAGASVILICVVICCKGGCCRKDDDGFSKA